MAIDPRRWNTVALWELEELSEGPEPSEAVRGLLSCFCSLVVGEASGDLEPVPKNLGRDLRELAMKPEAGLEGRSLRLLEVLESGLPTDAGPAPQFHTLWRLWTAAKSAPKGYAVLASGKVVLHGTEGGTRSLTVEDLVNWIRSEPPSKPEARHEEAFQVYVEAIDAIDNTREFHQFTLLQSEYWQRSLEEFWNWSVLREKDPSRFQKNAKLVSRSPEEVRQETAEDVIAELQRKLKRPRGAVREAEPEQREEESKNRKTRKRRTR